MRQTFRTFFIFFILSNVFLLNGCFGAIKRLFNSSSPVSVSPVMIPVSSIPLKIALAAGPPIIDVAVKELFGVSINTDDLVRQIIVGGVRGISEDFPSNDAPILILIDKGSNNIRYWKLTDRVHKITLRTQNPEEVVLNVINEIPLRIELWVSGNIKDVEIKVDFKENSGVYRK